MKFWLVNQGRSFENELKGGFIYAPKNNKYGSTFAHWQNVKNVKKGDIIFCNKKGNIMAIGIAMSNGYEGVIPDAIKGIWNDEGFMVDIDYHKLTKPFQFSNYKNEYMLNIETSKNPFTVKGTAKMGYLFPMEKYIAEFFLKKIKDKNINKMIHAYTSSTSNEMEEVAEEYEQFERISRGLVKGYSESEIKALEKKTYTYENKLDKEKAIREETDPKLKVTRMELANYNCEMNCNHKTFTCVSGKHQYLECHHIIPLNAQKDFIHIKLDSMFNMIAICPLCHRKVHYAVKEEKEKLFIQMYQKRKNEMLKYGFDFNQIIKIFNKYY